MGIFGIGKVSFLATVPLPLYGLHFNPCRDKVKSVTLLDRWGVGMTPPWIFFTTINKPNIIISSDDSRNQGYSGDLRTCVRMSIHTYVSSNV